MKLETHAVTKRYGAHAALDGASFVTGDEARVIARAATLRRAARSQPPEDPSWPAPPTTATTRSPAST